MLYSCRLKASEKFNKVIQGALGFYKTTKLLMKWGAIIKKKQFSIDRYKQRALGTDTHTHTPEQVLCGMSHCQFGRDSGGELMLVPSFPISLSFMLFCSQLFVVFPRTNIISRKGRVCARILAHLTCVVTVVWVCACRCACFSLPCVPFYGNYVNCKNMQEMLYLVKLENLYTHFSHTYTCK